MKSGIKKIISLTLAVLMLFSTLTLTSCNRSFDEEEVLAAANELLKQAEILNVVYYGSGIRYVDTDEEMGYYRRADLLHLEELGFSTIDELKAMTEKTFSDKYSQMIYKTILSSLTDDTSVVTLARYHQVYDEKTGEPTHIMVYSKFSLMMKGSLEYDYDTLRVVGSKKDKVNLLIDATVTNTEGKSQKTTVTVTLVEDENGWRIDAPVYANYNDQKDRYDELKDQNIKK